MIDHRAIPKVELHLHLEGAAQPALVRRLAAEKNIDLDGLFTEDGGYAWSDFTGFLRAYDAAAQVFDTPEAHRDLAEAVLTECAANGVIYAELFLSPDHSGADLVRWAEVLAAYDLFIGGKSMGGRMASLIADETQVRSRRYKPEAFVGASDRCGPAARRHPARGHRLYRLASRHRIRELAVRCCRHVFEGCRPAPSRPPRSLRG